MTRRDDQERKVRDIVSKSRAKNSAPHHIGEINDILREIDEGLEPWERDLGADGLPRAIEEARKQNAKGYGASNDELTGSWSGVANEMARSRDHNHAPTIQDLDGSIFSSD